MKIGINAHALGTKVGGDETYIRNVIRGLVTTYPNDDYNLFFTPPVPEDSIPPEAMSLRRIVVGPLNPFIRTAVTFPLAAARADLDVLHVQYIAPPICPVPFVVSVHDIAYERYPQFFTPHDVQQLRVSIPLSIRGASAVLTLSEYSKQDIIRRYKTPEDKIVVAPCAADPMYTVLHDDARLDAIREQYNTGDAFILSVGNLQPRKNLRTLIDAYVRLRRAGATTAKLVLVGKAAWLTDDIFTAARKSGYADDLVFTGYVPDDDLVALYNAATVFVYPSVFEGFGLPPLEAMACGTPVVCGNRSALPETVGAAALMVDPEDAEAMATAIARVLNDEATARMLRQRGPEQAARFSWDATARIIHDVYRSVARTTRGPLCPSVKEMSR